MRNLLYFLASLLSAVGVAYALHNWLAQHNDPGYVLIGFGHWSLETSLTVFTVGLVLGFFALYSFFRLLGVLMRLPGKMSKHRRNIKFNRSQDALINGLFDIAAGNWESAEKILIKHAASSGTPLLHYLIAARAAQSRGALDKRDEYLKNAIAQSSSDNLTVGLTQAELYLSEQQFEQALETLVKLQSINPNHPRVLTMMYQAYQKIGDWEGLSRLLPSLQQNKVLLETEVKPLQTKAYSSLLKKAAAQQDVQAIKACWDEIPENSKALPGIANIYFAAMIAKGAGNAVENDVIKQLGKHWDTATLELYATIESDNNERHLQTAEQWLAVYPNDPALLKVLGKLARKAGQMEKAEQYLLKSLNIDSSVGVCQLLGELMFEKGNKEKACDYFQRGLKLASNQVLPKVETQSEQLTV
ncbi:heme biosynthesis protein HemY [Methylomonas lenta]|uniref:Heme biosynthesis protein HemY n=1 Tax=Methylomonas lenta TaxID=980561 RepID=A0A177MZ36_9GAMM|nr:heme biosynthesis HemY N-terminal domain-containing protein [Methylomonas lenta]OAI10169.1 heme biosynthesis protein HemY [Methylomonas lenta]